MPPVGLIDLHIHGAFGVDVLEAGPSELDRMALGLEQRGVAGFLPTLVPVPLPALRKTVARLSAWIAGRRVGDGRGAMPLGIHFEGPFVSPGRCGALHPDLLLDARPENVAAFLDAAGPAAGRFMVTLAPEVPGGVALVRTLHELGWVVSIGHTSAPSELLDEALAAGARHMTHFGNAMAPLHHRAVGPIGWGLLRDDVTVDLIGDLRHLSAEMLHLVFRVKPAGRIALISDAIPPAGLPAGPPVPWPLWGETLVVDSDEARNSHGALAGSVALLDTALARLAAAGIPTAAARSSATDVPRRVLGL